MDQRSLARIFWCDVLRHLSETSPDLFPNAVQSDFPQGVRSLYKRLKLVSGGTHCGVPVDGLYEPGYDARAMAT